MIASFWLMPLFSCFPFHGILKQHYSSDHLPLTALQSSAAAYYTLRYHCHLSNCPPFMKIELLFVPIVCMSLTIAIFRMHESSTLPPPFLTDAQRDDVIFQVVVANNPKNKKKRKGATWFKWFNPPSKNYGKTIGTSGDAGASENLSFCYFSVTLYTERERRWSNDLLLGQLRTKVFHFTTPANDRLRLLLADNISAVAGTCLCLLFLGCEYSGHRYIASIIDAAAPSPGRACLSAEVRLRSEYNFRERKKFERKCHRQTDLLMEKDAEIASLKAQLSLMEAEAAEAIHLYSQVSVAEAAKVARVSELNSLKERNVEGQVAALESAAIIKDTELASFNAQITKLTQDLSNFKLSCDELSIKAASFESERDGLVDQVSLLEGTCFRLRDQVSGYEFFKEQYKAVQDAQVKILSDRVAELDSELMGMAVHLDKEFYPRFLTTIAGRRWIINRGFRLTGLVAGIDHGKAGRGLAEVAAYDPSVEETYVSAVLAFRDLDFNFLSQLESQKDASIACIMDSLCLEGPFAETSEVSRLQPAYKQLLLPIHRKEDNAVIRETSVSDSLNVVHDRVQKVKEFSEASTLGVPATTATTTALFVLVTTANVSSIPPISVADYEVADVPISRKEFSVALLSPELYAPLPSASVTSSPGLKLVCSTFGVIVFFHLCHASLPRGSMLVVCRSNLYIFSSTLREVRDTQELLQSRKSSGRNKGLDSRHTMKSCVQPDTITSGQPASVHLHFKFYTQID
ncbi:hypothetical protein Tco_0985974 [Tanacetum coccineum]